MRTRLALFVSLALAASTLGTAGASLAAGGKPVIGRPGAAPAQPVAGKRFSVAFHVARGKSVAFAVTLSGKALHHTDSFRKSVARTSVVIPANTDGDILAVKLTARGSGKATKTATFLVRGAAAPALSIDDAAQPEGNAGTTTMSFDVTLAPKSSKTVSVSYATSDDTATAGSDYVAAGGTVTFKPGQTQQTISVTVDGDTAVEPDETFEVTLSNPKNATVDEDTATGTIGNDDTGAPANAGSYQGATQEGNYVFFNVDGARTVSGFRANDISENCDTGGTLSGSISWTDLTIPVASDGSFVAQDSWSGSDTQGDVTFTGEQWKVTGRFTTGTTVTGTISISDQLTYRGSPVSCSSNVTFSATLQG